MKPYRFGYEIQDEKGNLQHRHEESDGKVQSGEYGYLDANGIFRKVIYIAGRLNLNSDQKTVSSFLKGLTKG